jgi:hypothetical protein
MRLYDYIRRRAVRDLLETLSKIHISFDGCATKGGKRDVLGIVAHYANKHGDLAVLTYCPATACRFSVARLWLR